MNIQTPISNVAEFMARSRDFEGIGPSRARALSEAFGGELIGAVSNMNEGVVQIIGTRAAMQAAAVIEEVEAELEIVAWLDQVGADIKPYQAVKLARAYRKVGVDLIAENPYLLVNILGWKATDALAASLGIAPDEMMRDVAAVEASLVAVLQQGSTRASEADIRKSCKTKLGRDLKPEAIAEAVRQHGAVKLSHDYQPPGAAYMEAHSALMLKALSEAEPSFGIPHWRDTANLVQHYQDETGITLTKPQRKAIWMGTRNSLMVLAGYAGSGKTTVLRGVCSALEATGVEPIIITLSARAAKRAAEATGRPAQTVARFLVENTSNYDQVELDLEPKAVIVDEASMLGAVEMWRVLKALNGASLILCGDPAQLPPVNAGIVFHALVKDEAIPRVILDRVHRQDERTGIPALAEGVRDGNLNALPPFTGAESVGVTFNKTDRDVVSQTILDYGKQLRDLGADRDDIQIIAPTNREIEAINTFFHTLRCEADPILWPHHGDIAEGEPIIWTTNNHDRGLTNGSMGRILEIGETHILAEIDGEHHTLDVEDRQSIELAYAISVHKAQGSQWRKVIIPIFQSRVVDRSLIYTALTRAQDQVLFVGDTNALSVAVAALPSAEKRRVGFVDWFDFARQR